MAKARTARMVNLYEAKTTLSSLVEQAAAGGEIVIAKAGKPMAKLVSIKSQTDACKPRNWDAGRDTFHVTYIAPDFDEPVWSDEELKKLGFL